MDEVEAQQQQQDENVMKDDGLDSTCQGDSSERDEESSAEFGSFPHTIKEISTGRSSSSTCPARTKRFILIGILVILILVPIVVLASIFGTDSKNAAAATTTNTGTADDNDNHVIASFSSSQVVFGANHALFFENECIHMEPLMTMKEDDTTSPRPPPPFCPTDYSVQDIQDMQLYDPYTLVVSLNTERVYVYSREMGAVGGNPITTKWLPIKSSALVPYLERFSGELDSEGFGKTVQLVASGRLFITSNNKTYYYELIQGDSLASASWSLRQEWSDLNHVTFQDSTQLVLYNTTTLMVYNIQSHQVLATPSFWQVDRGMPAAIYERLSERIKIQSVVLLEGIFTNNNLVMVYERNDMGQIMLEHKGTNEIMTFEQDAKLVGDFIVLEEKQKIYSILRQEYISTRGIWNDESTIVNIESHQEYIAILWENQQDGNRHVEMYYEP